MNVFCETPPNLSKAMGRVVAALKREAPRQIKFVDSYEAADLIVLHVIGFPETETAVNWILAHGKKYAIIQYCLRSTQKPSTRDWSMIWAQATLVWSYYDLLDLMRDDAQEGDPNFFFHFYCAPMGIDPVFSQGPMQSVKMYTLLTSGYVAESESVTEAAAAVYEVKGRHFHLGPRDAAPNADMCGLGISDPLLAGVYRRTCWVSGLRRAEGFEMPAAEGLACGARPIVFDAPHYRRWYNDLADFIPESSPSEVTASILEIFHRGFRPVTEDERKTAIDRFNWKNIIPEFWEGVL